ncbi:MAG: molybdenum cofactor biosynthesis protein B [Candidatus Bathyarchaeia archaeon]
MSRTAAEHKEGAPAHVRFAVITVSTSRFKRLKEEGRVEDPSGDLIASLLQEAGHAVTLKRIVSDDKGLIEGTVREALKSSRIDAIITCGGTGVSPTDVTIETITPILDKELPGFGELLRRISFDQIGSPALLTRATAGIIGGRPIFCIPGSPQATEVALKSLIIPEVGHIIKHAKGRS